MTVACNNPERASDLCPQARVVPWDYPDLAALVPLVDAAGVVVSLLPPTLHIEAARLCLERGRNLVTGLPESVEISSIEVREALNGSVSIVVDQIRDTLDETPPELIADLMETGICLAGGSSQLKGLADRIGEETNMRTWVAQDSMTCVARGAGKVLESLDVLREVLVGTDERRPMRSEFG